MDVSEGLDYSQGGLSIYIHMNIHDVSEEREKVRRCHSKPRASGQLAFHWANKNP